MDEVVEEHAVKKADEEITILVASETKQGSLVESNVGPRADPDKSETGAITLQELGHQAKHDGTQLFVQNLQGCASCPRAGEGIVCSGKLWMENQRQFSEDV